MTAKTAEQIYKELEDLRASKEEIESKISSLSYDLRIIKDEEKNEISNSLRMIGRKTSIN